MVQDALGTLGPVEEATSSLSNTGAEGIHPLGVGRLYFQRHAGGRWRPASPARAPNFDLRLFYRDPLAAAPPNVTAQTLAGMLCAGPYSAPTPR